MASKKKWFLLTLSSLFLATQVYSAQILGGMPCDIDEADEYDLCIFEVKSRSDNKRFQEDKRAIFQNKNEEQNEKSDIFKPLLKPFINDFLDQ
jgi:hypothetical protein